MRIFHRIIIGFLILLTVSVGVFYFYFFYTDVVQEGSKYGFTIGMTKNEAVEVIIEKYADSEMNIILSPRNNEAGVMGTLYLDVSMLNKSIVKEKDVWYLEFQKKNTNVLQLFFLKGRLTKMYRYHRFFIP